MEWSTATVGVVGMGCLTAVWYFEIQARYRLAAMRVGMMTRLSLAATGGRVGVPTAPPAGAPAAYVDEIECPCPACTEARRRGY